MQGKYCGVECTYFANGYVVEYWETQYCGSSGFIVPGSSLLATPLLGFAYLVMMVWLFVGVAIICDKFMESIEKITEQTK
jgi:hypothetical protein